MSATSVSSASIQQQYHSINQIFEDKFKQAEDDYSEQKQLLKDRELRLASLYNEANKDYLKQNDIKTPLMFRLPSYNNRNYRVYGIDPSEYGKSTVASKTFKLFSMTVGTAVGTAAGLAIASPVFAVGGLLMGFVTAGTITTSGTFQKWSINQAKQISDKKFSKYFNSDGTIINLNVLLETDCYNDNLV